MLADHHIHCLVVPDLRPAGGRKSWGLVSDRAVLRMLHDGAAHMTARDMAQDDPSASRRTTPCCASQR